MTICEFTVEGRAVPAVRMTQRSKFSPQAQRYLAYKGLVGWTAKDSYKDAPVAYDVGVNVNIYLNGGNQGDIDNYFKSITDSLNHIIYVDDRQVKEMNARKIESKEEKVEVEVYKI